MKTTTEMLQGLCDDQVKMGQVIDLYFRYQDEKEYEPIKNYISHLENIISQPISKMSKRPFGFYFLYKKDKVHLTVKESGSGIEIGASFVSI